MSKRRLKPNREFGSKNETARLRKDVRQLRQQIEHLTRQVARERKKTERLLPQASASVQQAFEPRPRTKEETCPKCEAAVRYVKTQYKLLVVCPDCLWRQTR